MKRLFVVALLIVGIVAVATPAGATENQKITGTFTLTDSHIGGGTTGCYGMSGYDDIRQGLQVVVRDRRDKVLATSRLGVGTRPAGQYSSVTCAFDFKLKQVPTSAFYSIEVGHRGAITYSLKDMAKNHWKVGFTL